MDVTSSVDDRYQTSAMTASPAWWVTHKSCCLQLHGQCLTVISLEILNDRQVMKGSDYWEVHCVVLFGKF